MPELEPICICGDIWSPTQDTCEECPGCKTLFHPVCMRQHSDLRCFSCKEPLPKKLVYSHSRELMQAPSDDSVTQGQPEKRQKVEEFVKTEQIGTESNQAF